MLCCRDSRSVDISKLYEYGFRSDCNYHLLRHIRMIQHRRHLMYGTIRFPKPFGGHPQQPAGAPEMYAATGTFLL